MKIDYPLAQQYALHAVGEILGEQGWLVAPAKAVLVYVVEEIERLRRDVELLQEAEAARREKT